MLTTTHHGRVVVDIDRQRLCSVVLRRQPRMQRWPSTEPRPPSANYTRWRPPRFHQLGSFLVEPDSGCLPDIHERHPTPSRSRLLPPIPLQLSCAHFRSSNRRFHGLLDQGTRTHWLVKLLIGLRLSTRARRGPTTVRNFKLLSMSCWSGWSWSWRCHYSPSSPNRPHGACCPRFAGSTARNRVVDRRDFARTQCILQRLDSQHQLAQLTWPQAFSPADLVRQPTSRNVERSEAPLRFFVRNVTDSQPCRQISPVTFASGWAEGTGGRCRFALPLSGPVRC